MKPNDPIHAADDALRAACEPLLASAEASPALLFIVESEVLALLTQASRAGLCSRVAIYRLDGRLKLARRMAFAQSGLPLRSLRCG